MQIRPGLFLIAAALAASAHARDYQAGALRLVHPTTPPTASGQSAAGVYLAIENTASTPDRLVSVSSEMARQASLHVVNPAGHGMQEAAGLEIPAKGRVELAQGGSHIMLGGLNGPLKAGDRFALRLSFEKAGAVLVNVLVTPSAPAARQAHSGH